MHSPPKLGGFRGLDHWQVMTGNLWVRSSPSEKGGESGLQSLYQAIAQGAFKKGRGIWGVDAERLLAEWANG